MKHTVTAAQRRQSALDFSHQTSLTIPVLLDGMDNRANDEFHVYQAAYVVLDSKGLTAYHSGLAAYALDPNAVENALKRLTSAPSAGRAGPAAGPYSL